MVECPKFGHLTLSLPLPVNFCTVISESYIFRAIRRQTLVSSVKLKNYFVSITYSRVNSQKNVETEQPGRKNPIQFGIYTKEKPFFCQSCNIQIFFYITCVFFLFYFIEKGLD